MTHEMNMNPKEMEDPKYQCRMFEQKYPKEDDLCLVVVTSSSEMGTYVALKEYNEIQGMVPMSEHSRRKFKQTQTARVGKEEVATVIKVDPESGFIDLSFKKTKPDDKQNYLQKYGKLKEGHLIMRTVAIKTQSNLEELYKQFGWPLATEYGSLHDAFRKSLTDATIFDKYGIESNILEMLKKTISNHMALKPSKFKAVIEVSCYASGGVESVKKALLKGIEVTNSNDFSIKLISSPTYGLLLTELDKQKGFEIMNNAIETIKKVIEEEGGNLIVKKEPNIVSKEEENDDIESDTTSQENDE